MDAPFLTAAVISMRAKTDWLKSKPMGAKVIHYIDQLYVWLTIGV